MSVVSSSPYSFAWRQCRRLDEDFFARAYESLGGEKRARLKLCIARLHRIFGVSAMYEGRELRFAEGFGLHADDEPTDWALLACAADCPSPAVFLAALMPAVFAGVNEILVCFTGAGGRAVRPGEICRPLLAALELAGVEEACLARPHELAEALAPSASKSSAENSSEGRADARGRIVCLGKADDFSPLALAALSADIPFRLLPVSPPYHSLRLDAVTAHCFERANAPGVTGNSGRKNPAAGRDYPQVCLDAGQEDVWVWPDLGPDWFRRKRLQLYTFNGNGGS